VIENAPVVSLSVRPIDGEYVPGPRMRFPSTSRTTTSISPVVIAVPIVATFGEISNAKDAGTPLNVTSMKCASPATICSVVAPVPSKFPAPFGWSKRLSVNVSNPSGARIWI
jgi:hypothetical protein